MADKPSISDLLRKAEKDPDRPMIPACYDASGATYTNSRTKVTITCSEHGEFEILPRDIERRTHLCPGCRDHYKSQLVSQKRDEFIQRIDKKFPDQFDCSGMVFQNTQTPVSIVCKRHNKSCELYPYDLENLKYVCTTCRDEALKAERLRPLDEFLEKAKSVHGGKYSYAEVDYQGSHTKITIVCQLHGDFEQTPSSHLRGRGCPECGVTTMREKKTRRKH